MSMVTDYEASFVAYLRKLVQDDDRAALAALRRGLGKAPGEAVGVLRYVVKWLPTPSSNRRADERREAAFYQVAALFAWHQGSWLPDGERPRATNIGASLRVLAERSNSVAVERRFIALLNSHADDLDGHLRHAVGLLKAGDVPIDWGQLLHDLLGWEYEDRPIQRAWARAFWGQSSVPADAPTDPPLAPNDRDETSAADPS